MFKRSCLLFWFTFGILFFCFYVCTYHNINENRRLKEFFKRKETRKNIQKIPSFAQIYF